MREHERQIVWEWPAIEELVERQANGWRLKAMEWERDTPAAELAVDPPKAPIEIPYGLRVTGGHRLEEDPRERQVLMMLLNSIVDDRPLSHAAADLNRAGYMTREGDPWTPAEAFKLLPRLIEAGPAIFASDDWIAQRERRSRTA
jgi:hypothetical protein